MNTGARFNNNQWKKCPTCSREFRGRGDRCYDCKQNEMRRLRMKKHAEEYKAKYTGRTA